MFNIIETPWNYFTCELLHDNFSSNVALHFNVSHWRPIFGGKLFGGVFCRPSTAPVDKSDVEVGPNVMTWMQLNQCQDQDTVAVYITFK